MNKTDCIINRNREKEGKNGFRQISANIHPKSYAIYKRNIRTPAGKRKGIKFQSDFMRAYFTHLYIFNILTARNHKQLKIYRKQLRSY